MALLPLAGWAANISEGTLLVPNIPYGTTAAQHFALNDFKLTVGGVIIDKEGYEIDGYYKEEGGTKYANVNTFDVRDAVYYVKVTALGDNTGELTGTFQIVKRPLTISFSTAVGKNTKVFDNNATAEEYTYTLKDGETDVTANAADYGLIVGRDNPTKYDKGSYAFTYSVSATNYTLTRAAGNTNKYEITAADIADLADEEDVTFTFNAATGGYIYSGETQSPTITATEYNDATVTFNTYWYTDAITGETLEGLSTNDAVEPLEARVGDDKYYAMIEGTGNYTGRIFVDTWKFNIAKKAANVKLTKKTKVYDGQEGDPTIVKINYTGLVPADAQAGIGNFGGNIAVRFSDYEDDDAEHIVADVYSVEAYVVDEDNTFSKNYSFELETTNNKGNFYEITTRPITIAAKNLVIDFGEDAEEHIADAVVIADEDEDNINAELTSGTIVEGEVNQILGDLEFAIAETYDADDATTWTDAYILKKKAGIADDHYINNYTVTLTPANIVFTKTAQTVYVNTIEKVYGDAIAQTDFSYDADEDLKEGTVEYEIWNAAGTEKKTDWTNLIPNVYQIKINAEKAKADPDGQRTIGSIEPGYLVITAKALTINLKNIKINAGATRATLQQYTSQADYADQLAEQLVGNDEVNFEIRFVNENEDGTLTSDPGDYAAGNGITGHAFTAEDNEDLDEEDQYDLKQNAYYIFNFTGGALKVQSANTLILDDEDAVLATRIADAAALCAEDEDVKYNVTFNRAKLTGKFWNAMVLPFETTVREVSNALGYAVVDLLETSTDGDAHFKLAFGTIPANTPFMVKTDADVVFEGVNTENPEAADYQAEVEFENKTIVTTNIVDDFHGSQALFNDGHNKFYGIYTPYILAANNTTERMLGRATAAEKDNSWQIFQGYAVKNTRGILILEKNLSARIFIEEPDGSTTVINSIDADGVAMPAEGWYTLNGVKLQSMPTEKGVYINNGKKVVIK